MSSSSTPTWVFFSSAMLAGIGVYLWWGLVVRTTSPGTWGRRIGNVLGVWVVLSPPVALLGQFLMPMGFQRVTGWPAWTGYAFIVCTAMVAVALEPVRLVLWLRRRRASRPDTGASPDGTTSDGTTPGEAVPSGSATAVTAAAAERPVGTPNDLTGTITASITGSAGDSRAEGVSGPSHRLPRRLVLERALAVGTVAIGATLTGIGVANAVGAPGVVRRTIAIRNLPAAAVGTRIVLVTDLHVGGVTRAAATRRMVELVNAQNPDIVCLVGDFSDGSADDLAADLQPLADLRPTEGTYFVTGNHEFYFDVQSWYDFLPTVGVQVLRNESVDVRGVLFAGVHDPTGEPTGQGPDLDLALRDRAAGQPVVLLSHNPVLLDEAVAADVDLMVSGHTHGGQFLPGVWIVALTTRTLSGHYTFGDTQVQVSNGVGFWGPIARLGAPTDITVLELVRA